MNRFESIFEKALNSSKQEMTPTDVKEVMKRLRAEAMAPGSLTSGDSTLVPLRDSDDEMSEDSTTASVAGFDSPKAFQPTKDGQKIAFAQMIADAISKACEFGREDMTFDNLEEFRSKFAEKTRMRNYTRRNERFGRDPLGTEGLKPDSLT